MFSACYSKPISHPFHNTLRSPVTHSGHLLDVTYICLRCSFHTTCFLIVFLIAVFEIRCKSTAFFSYHQIFCKKNKNKMHLHHLQRAPIITRTRHARACSTCNIPASHNAPAHPTAHDNACVTQRDFHIHAHMHTYARAKAFSAQKFLPIRIFRLSTTTKNSHTHFIYHHKKNGSMLTHRSVQMKSHSLHKSIVRHCAVLTA